MAAGAYNVRSIRIGNCRRTLGWLEPVVFQTQVRRPLVSIPNVARSQNRMDLWCQTIPLRSDPIVAATGNRYC